MASLSTHYLDFKLLNSPAMPGRQWGEHPISSDRAKADSKRRDPFYIGQIISFSTISAAPELKIIQIAAIDGLNGRNAAGGISAAE
jgi:hypothetical protein